MEFTKIHGLGNDYIYLNCMEGMPHSPAELAIRLSDRHFGIGGDGIICVGKSQTADFRMRMFNADGSEGDMCGNGIRGLAKYVYDKGLSRKSRLTVETNAGLRELMCRITDGTVTEVTVDMGEPVLGQETVFELGNITYVGTEILVGNSHVVIPVSELTTLNVPEVGARIEQMSRFSDGVNVEFVRVRCRERLEMRVRERGSGETLACGTGACAAAAAMAAKGITERTVTVSLRGGDLEVQWRQRDGHLLMTGPAETVFEGWMPGEVSYGRN